MAVSIRTIPLVCPARDSRVNLEVSTRTGAGYLHGLGQYTRWMIELPLRGRRCVGRSTRSYLVDQV
jgi:hypothetical protein